MKKLEGNLYRAGETVTNYTEEEYEQLTPGAYICTITSVKDTPDKEYLQIEYDIAEGEHAGYYQRLSDRAQFWGGRVNESYSKGNKTFSKFCKAINITNPGYIFNPYADGSNSDERSLIGRTIGVVLHEREYKSRDGKIKSRMDTYPWGLISKEKALSGEFRSDLLEKVPYVEESSPEEQFLSIPDTDTPFN